MFLEYALALEALKIKYVSVKLVYLILREVSLPPHVVNIACVHKVLTLFVMHAQFFEQVIPLMRLSLVVLIISISVNVPEPLWVCLKVLRVNNVSIFHVLVVSDDSLYDALVASEIREPRVHTHASPTEEKE
jgi:hypothetical protein